MYVVFGFKEDWSECRELGYFTNVWDLGFLPKFSQKYYDSLKRDSIFWQGSTMVLGDYC
jgi:hypothetical protein